MNKFSLDVLTAPLKSQMGLEQAVLQSLLNWGEAQKNDLIENGKDKQGWWANEFVTGVASRNWTLDRAKQTQDTLNKSVRFTEQSLQWLIVKNVAKDISVNAYFEQSKLIRLIEITLVDDKKYQVKI